MSVGPVGGDRAAGAAPPVGTTPAGGTTQAPGPNLLDGDPQLAQWRVGLLSDLASLMRPESFAKLQAELAQVEDSFSRMQPQALDPAQQYSGRSDLSAVIGSREPGRTDESYAAYAKAMNRLRGGTTPQEQTKAKFDRTNTVEMLRSGAATKGLAETALALDEEDQRKVNRPPTQQDRNNELNAELDEKNNLQQSINAADLRREETQRSVQQAELTRSMEENERRKRENS